MAEASQHSIEHNAKREWRRADIAALIPALIVFAVHGVLAGRYDLFRDELYFIVCGLHPAFGYVDQPPLVPLAAAFLYKLGLGVWGLRLPTAVAAGALVWLSVRFVRLLGGNGLAIAFAALACAIAPMMMGLVATLNTSAFGPLAWTLVAYLMVRTARDGDSRALIWAGLVAGVALQVKYAMLFWMVGLTIGLLLTPERRLLLRPAFWIGATLAAVIAVPSFIWQLVHGFPFLELGEAAKAKNADIAPLPFFTNQLMVMNPVFAPLWIAGLIAPFTVKRLRDLRFLVIAAVVVVVIVRVGHGKDYYLAPLYPTLFVIGAVTLAPLVRGMTARILAGGAIAAAVVFSALAAPMALPILSPQALSAYITRIGVAPQQQERSFKGTVLPQLFADQLGWRDFTRQVEAAWSRIPVAERAVTGIKADNYGEAAALDLYGKGLPPALSGHNQYFLWGLRGQHPRDLLVIQHDLPALRPYCRQVVVLGTTWSRYAMAYENGKVIALCRGVTPPLATLWPSLKMYR
ncbi:glycosyltransferase family 39 protein [Stakelama sediminis]|uniref:4-amino-4-deoxy-L-arabinose transferase-like glycosyltransferase n=1 Tax=Stakelama sediminis TaxID=463200 RepID=A0A840YV72_9SPHN|nr:glycosyltransferase family 39 protein [Stakelama sediminis]MBB5717434.1 4-amino-4-deoxy-L-arabinose transferase-like glycosyltransferase [Stakelama sediminis]